MSLSVLCVNIYVGGGVWCVVCGGDRFLKYAPDGKNDARKKNYVRLYLLFLSYFLSWGLYNK